jgi:hypothetical protein
MEGGARRDGCGGPLRRRLPSRTAGRAVRWIARGSALGAALVAFVDCSLLLDWSGFTNGDGGSRSGADASNGADAGDGTGADIALATDGSDAVAPDGGDLRCVPGLSSQLQADGWNGPLEFYQGTGLPPACGPGYSSAPVFDGDNGSGTAQDATCSACACAPPQGASCTAPLLTFYSDPMCTTPCGAAVGLEGGTCAVASACAAFQIGGTALTGDAGCAASGGTATLSPAGSNVARACGASPVSAVGSCKSTEVTMPALAAGFQTLCIMHIGTASCPIGAYSSGPSFFSTTMDTRACSPCTCGPATGAACSFPAAPPPVGYRYFDPMCAAPNVPQPLKVPNGCQTFTGTLAFKLFPAPTFDPGSCAPGGGQPTGTATHGVQETFCCLPP